MCYALDDRVFHTQVGDMPCHHVPVGHMIV